MESTTPDIIFLEQYFTKNVICYCAECCDARGENRVTVCGNPPQEYARATGWCKFELRLEQYTVSVTPCSV